MNRKKRLLILTTDTGFGHRRAARAVEIALKEAHGDECECKIINPINDYPAPFVLRQTQNNYDQMVRNRQAFYRLTYRLSETPAITFLAEMAFRILMVRLMERILADVQPDLVLSTYQIYHAPLAAALAARPVKLPFFSVVTDLEAVHRLWFHPGLDRLFVSSSEVRDQAVAKRVSPDKVVLTGIPVDPRIAQEKRSQAEIRTSLGWDPGLTTLLAVGSRRVNNLLGYLTGIDRPGSPVQLAIVTGGDDASFLQAQARSWRIPVHLYQFVENVPEMMLAADLLVTKAGGLVIAEGLSCGLPIILIDSLPGQETGNIRYIDENQAGAALQKPEEMPRVLDGWLENSQARLKQLALNAKTIGKPEAAGRIAEMIWQTVTSKH